MNELTIAKGTLSTSEMINNFLSYIDRSEQTQRTYIINLRQFVAYLNYKGITRPIRDDIIAYRKWLESEHEAIIFDQVDGWKYRLDSDGNIIRLSCKANTIKIYLQSVKQFFKWTAINGLYPNIADNIHAPNVSSDHKKDSLTVEDVQTVEASLSSCDHMDEKQARLYAMYLLAVNAGLRTIELSRANIRDLETKGENTFLYVHGKGRSEADQIKALAPEVAEAIRHYLSLRTDHGEALFVSTGNRSGGKRIATTTISTMLKKALVDAGYNSRRLTAHSLRHTAAQNVMDMTGSNIYITQQYMRHSTPATTERYLENNRIDQDIRTASDLYQRYHGNKNQTANNLESIISVFTPEQLEQLTSIARIMAK